MFESGRKKIKYRNLHFKRELEKARQYKRPARQLPETKTAVFLEKIGLGSRLSKFFTLLAFCLLVYLVFIPNFLFIKSVQITGDSLVHKQQHEDIVASFLNSSRAWPQKNLLLLSSGKLKQDLAKDPWVISVDSVEKVWPNRLAIRLTERREFALVETKDAKMVFSNDGRYLSTLTGSTTPDNTLVVLKTSEDLSQDKPLPSASLELIRTLQQKIPEICHSTVSAYDIYPSTNPDVEAETAAGYKLIFDTSNDSTEVLDNLSVLIDKLSQDEKNRLFYIDLRIKNKAYVCFKGTSCTTDTVFQNPFVTGQNASTSASSTLPTPQ